MYLFLFFPWNLKDSVTEHCVLLMTLMTELKTELPDSVSQHMSELAVAITGLLPHYSILLLGQCPFATFLSLHIEQAIWVYYCL